MSIKDGLQEPFLEQVGSFPTPEKSSHIQKKRKRNSDKDQAPKKTARLIDDEGLDTEKGINTAFSHMDNHLLADYMAQRTRKYENDLSLIELEDKYLPGEY